MSDPVRRLVKQRIEELGLSKKAVSVALNKNHAYIQQYLERNIPLTLPEEVRGRLSEILQVPERELKKPTGAKLPPIRGVVTTGLDVVPDTGVGLPVQGRGAAGPNGCFEFNGTIIDYLPRPSRLVGVQDAYAIYVAGDSMSPWREDGQIVYVHPHQPVREGDFVVVQVKPAKQGDGPAAYIKRLAQRNAKVTKLIQYNPRKTITIPENRVLSLHRIMEWAELIG